MFVALQHNITDVFTSEVVHYTYGVKDLCIVFFYFLISIVMHAVIQEYLLDKVNRKLHLSKIKHSKFNESGQLLIFFIISIAWASEIIRREGYLTSISKLWADYPHLEMTYLFKFYFIIQISYWLHAFPELYFQKVKRDEMGARITYATLYGIFFTAAYALNFTRIAICLSILHYSVEALFHLSRLLYFADKLQIVNYSFKLWNVLFVLVRLGSITLSVLTFWYGLATHQTTQFNVAEGNFNTQIIRINCLAAVCLLEAWMMWNFINFHLRRMREKAAEAAALRKKSAGGVRKKPKKTEKEDVSELPEVDQNTNKGLIHRPNKASPKVK